MNRNPKVEWFFQEASPWQEAYEQLSVICLESGLQEDLKWGCPCYTMEGRNVVLIHGFKEYCALLFFKGALLNNAHGLLIQQTENVQSARQIRFTNVAAIRSNAAVLAACIREAIAVERAGLKVTLKKTADYTAPEEWLQVVAGDGALKAAFEALTPGRQRAYLFHFAQPKQSKTRVARIEKHRAQILEGKGLND
ncbi:Uncharacterized conserved protein YdeI, YjbR/CyaY-like superfamily, DUF1801 family [Cnuella takakiae]|uniref:Uncharacterized conserved protein YdeI, YjbR/CyaY-like superfamily, DUF1801 family n=1 Tax=Cnuella takakiae TaxID=1302690 RepID=A0A1M4T1Z4_9BACT|nr:DUF1801 domain-containing protein [Cnuella takakiae]OLY90662.1 hypothetical protein BUE76_01160 [Cnuella takakiae]SHE38499.1 Uncharacterized conserved protein YdeI, YjbR/CyaY-like superfamily, DUF1801 family [Cnuella takakiae]